MIEWADTEEARKDFFVSRLPVSKQEFVFFYRGDHPFEWESKDDLAGKIIGLTSGYLYSDLFNDIRDNPRFNFQVASTDEANFEKLISGRIDIFPMERNVGLTILRREFSPEQASQVKINEKPFSSFEPFVFLSKKNPSNAPLMDEYNEEFQKFSETQDFETLTNSCRQ